MVRSIDVTTATTTGQTVKKEYSMQSGTYRALEIQIDGDIYTVPVTGVENARTRSYDADRVYTLNDMIVVEAQDDGDVLETIYDGRLASDGDLMVANAHALSEDEASDVDPAERVLWTRE